METHVCMSVGELNPEFELPHFWKKKQQKKKLCYPVTFRKWVVSNLSRKTSIMRVIVDSRHLKALELIVHNHYSVMYKNNVCYRHTFILETGETNCKSLLSYWVLSLLFGKLTRGVEISANFLFRKCLKVFLENICSKIEYRPFDWGSVWSWVKWRRWGGGIVG